MSYSTEFKRIFAELIEDMDCKKSEIPKKLGIDYNIYVKIKEYGAIPRPVILERIADYFDVSVEYLLGRTDDPYFERSAKKHTFRERYDELRAAKGMTSQKCSTSERATRRPGKSTAISPPLITCSRSRKYSAYRWIICSAARTTKNKTHSGPVCEYRVRGFFVPAGRVVRRSPRQRPLD